MDTAMLVIAVFVGGWVMRMLAEGRNDMASDDRK